MERLNNKTNNKKKEMIEALKKSLGVVTNACNKVGINRSTHYDWLKDDEEYKAAVLDIEDIAIDFVESKLHQSINNVSDTAIIFYLKTKAKKRGYIERQELDHTTKGEAIKQVFKIGDHTIEL
jgi:hypothetical protein